jgi:hypothetical protein
VDAAENPGRDDAVGDLVERAVRFDDTRRGASLEPALRTASP